MDPLHDNQEKTYAITSAPYVKYMPTSWEPIDISQQFVYYGGATWYVPLQRGGTTWKLICENTIDSAFNGNGGLGVYPNDILDSNKTSKVQGNWW